MKKQLYTSLPSRSQVEGKRKGLEESKLEGKLEVARNLQAAGITLEIIMQTTGLSREEIERRI